MVVYSKQSLADLRRETEPALVTIESFCLILATEGKKTRLDKLMLSEQGSALPCSLKRFGCHQLESPAAAAELAVTLRVPSTESVAIRRIARSIVAGVIRGGGPARPSVLLSPV